MEIFKKISEKTYKTVQKRTETYKNVQKRTERTKKYNNFSLNYLGLM